MHSSRLRRHVFRRRSRTLAAVLAVAAAALSVVTAAPAAYAASASTLWDDLDSQLTALVAEAGDNGFTMGVSIEDLSGAYGGGILSEGSQKPVKAASVIKLPLLALLMSEADAGRLSLDEKVTIPKGSSNIVGGAGTLQSRSFPLEITVGELMTLMVQVSDNTATNVLIDRAGGFDAINAYIKTLGYQTMWFGRKMIHTATPPLGENWINANEVTDLISKLYRHQILSASSSEYIIGLMKGQLVNTKFGAVIPRKYLANKTGELGDVSHDSGIILLDGREVALTVTTSFASGGLNKANVYVQRAAKLVFDQLQQPIEPPVPAATTPASDAWPALTDRLDPIVAEAAAAGVDVGVAIEDLSGYYGSRTVYLGKTDRYTTASAIKMALAATVMNQVQSGRLSLDDVVTITEDERYPGSGTLQNNAFPQDVSVGRMLDLMVTISDNTATNKLVDVVGGVDAINAVIADAGIGVGDLHFGRKMFGPIVGVYGDVWLTPYGVNRLMALFYDISTGSVVKPDLLTAESARKIIGLMRNQQVKTKLGAVIPSTVLADKTGENALVSHDIGLLLVPGQELTLSVFSTGKPGFEGDISATANPFLQRIGAAVYAYVLATAPEKETPGGNGTPTVEPSETATDGSTSTTTPTPAASSSSPAATALASTGSDATMLPGLVTLAAILSAAGLGLTLRARRTRRAMR